MIFSEELIKGQRGTLFYVLAQERLGKVQSGAGPRALKELRFVSLRNELCLMKSCDYQS